jgi:transposase
LFANKKGGIPMNNKVPKLGARHRRRILSRGRKANDVNTYRRFHALFLLTGGFGVTKIHRMLGMARSTIYRVLDRYLFGGLGALEDRRCENGIAKVNLAFYHRLTQMVGTSPEDYDWCRPTWTRELLCRTMFERFHVQVSTTTMGRALADIGARSGRPRPVVNCPWPKERRERALREIRRLVEDLPENEVAYYQDEVDIHLNPKIGRDWMLLGQQKLVITPGQNEKRYIAGALNAQTGKMIWVEGKSKNSGLFCDNVDQIMKRHRKARRVHIILDNYIIHKSKITHGRLKEYESRLVLHFLPPYCPNSNRIERKWQDLHAEVTRNHKCNTMNKLMRRVRAHLQKVGSNSEVHLRKRDLRKAA